MSEGKLLFSFSDGMNLALESEKLGEKAIIRFGTGFEDLEMCYDNNVLFPVSQEEAKPKVPTVEIKISQGTEKNDIETRRARQSLVPPAVFCSKKDEEEKEKLTKTQRRNRRKRDNKRREKLKPMEGNEAVTTNTAPVRVLSNTEISTDEEYVPEPAPGTFLHQPFTGYELEGLKNVDRLCFNHYEGINGKWVNILEGLELHTGIFSDKEQMEILHEIYGLREKGRAGLLRPRTYSEPRKWMRGKGRVTIQFGCCYNYATDSEGNPPGIIRHEEVDPMPSILRSMIKRMVAWQVMPPEVIPDSCIINIYEAGDCIPPHIDSHDFLRPFCTVSFLRECLMTLGTELKIKGPGEFSGPVSIALPIGSVLVLAGNGADLAKHCIPGVPGPRISITFRKMHPRNRPFTYKPEPELQGLSPLDVWALRYT